MSATFDQVRAIALALPGAAEVPAWEEEQTFRVNNKIFVMGMPTGSSVSLKASLEDQAELVATDPETFARAPYVGRYGWVSVRLAGVDPDELRALIIEAWRRTAPKRSVAAYDAEP